MNNDNVLHSGEMYLPTDEKLMREQVAYQEKLYD